MTEKTSWLDALRQAAEAERQTNERQFEKLRKHQRWVAIRTGIVASLFILLMAAIVVATWAGAIALLRWVF